VDEDVLSSVGRPDEPVTLRPGEVLTQTFKHRTRFGSHCPAEKERERETPVDSEGERERNAIITGSFKLFISS